MLLPFCASTVNGLGERCGNAPLASVQAILHDHLNVETNIVEDKLNDISRLVESYSGVVIAPNQPIVGENVFTQVAGVHADGDNKDRLYCNALVPERFGRKREYALGKASGKANIEMNLHELGLVLTPDQVKKITKRITELGDRKSVVTQEDLPFIVSDVLKHDTPEDTFALGKSMASGLPSWETFSILGPPGYPNPMALATLSNECFIISVER